MSTCYLAIDVGGTKLAVGIVADTGEVLVRDRVATRRIAMNQLRSLA
jgi:predicted NBD/HSP70 family sugar kinase